MGYTNIDKVLIFLIFTNMLNIHIWSYMYSELANFANSDKGGQFVFAWLIMIMKCVYFLN